MKTIFRISVMSVALAAALSGCQKAAEPAPPAAEPQAAAPASAPAPAPAPDLAAAWPTSLPVFGDGFPNPGDPCRRIGENELTVNYLDDSASLVGCLSADDAVKLGGRVVATIDGVTLLSVPNAAAVPGDGDGQGDAQVAGTAYHATAQIPCAGYEGAPAGLCEAGVVRGTETGTFIEVKLPDGRLRIIFFNADGSFLTFSTAEADGTAAMPIASSREGDTTIATLGTERYEIPDAFVMGD
jgi:hypothetical protein